MKLQDNKRLSKYFFGIIALPLAIILTGCATTSPRQYYSNPDTQYQSPSQTLSHLVIPKTQQAPPVKVTPNKVSALPRAVPRTVPKTNVEPSMYHRVQPKETLWRIGKKYGVPVKAIMNTNHITDPNQLKVGQVLYIPSVSEYKPPIPLLGKSERWKYIIVHHTATPEGNAKSIHNLHLKRGWRYGLGYHFIIDNGTKGRKMGEIEVGHRWKKQMNGAHANKSNMNKLGIGISLIGNFSEKDVPEEQLKSLAYLVNTLSNYYRIPRSRILPHNGVPGAATECPGTRFPWRRFMKMLDQA